MEDSKNEIEMDQPFRSPPRRRRSTFFERRDSIAPQPITDKIETIPMKDPDVEKRNLEMSIYHQKLLSEKDQWKTEVTERRNQYHDARQQYQMAIKSQSRTQVSYTALTDEDIEFLKGKPKLFKLVESQQQLHKSMKETVTLMRRAMDLDNIIIKKCEDKINKINEYIFNNSTIDPVD